MNTTIAARLETLRTTLRQLSLDGFIVPHGDEYASEYPPPCARRLHYVTGFTGSAGTAIILPGRAVLFRDGRYVLQAAAEVSPELFEFAHLAEDPPHAWLARNAPQGMRLGYDPWLHTPRQADALREALAKTGGTLVAVGQNPIDAIWPDRPSPPCAPIFVHPEQLAGESSASKRTRLAHDLRAEALDAAVLTDPPSIAWLLNVRGGDVPCAPLPLSFAILNRDATVDWFVDPAKLNDLALSECRVHPLERLSGVLRGLAGKRVLLEQSGASYPGGAPSAVADILAEAGAVAVFGANPCMLPKACKNEAELAGSRAAHLRDGVALAKFLSWFERADKAALDELSVAAKLEEFRAASNLYRGPSFETIAGSGPNGAIVHYHADATTNRRLDSGSLLLLDSGAQYEDGTTDITRTLSLGTATPEMREMFTRVLKGHVAIAAIRFPPGTSGLLLDVLARQFLWSSGLDFAHGTGHGVGSYLSVHEGPQRISPRADPVPLRAGMIVSNEPGYYQAGDYGIRIENLVAVREGEDGFLDFETLSHTPIDRRLIIADMLSRQERNWLDTYHLKTRELLLQHMDEPQTRWLNWACAPL